MYWFRWAERENCLNYWLINPARKLKEENIWSNTEQLTYEEVLFGFLKAQILPPETQRPKGAIKKKADGIIHMLYSHYSCYALKQKWG